MMASMQNDSQANREKNAAALNSVLAAVVLTVFKIVVGLATNSLGILAEAAHSGLDLIAALVTLFAVRISGKPPDVEHHYGHGKVENISSLFETFLLFLTCAWIIYESVQRLLYKSEIVEATFWAFLVMSVSIVVDYSRSRMLYRAARKHNSQALEADALHFSTDIWSSSVVILGLIGVRLAGAFPGLAFMAEADAVAALIVAMIVIYVSSALGIRTVQALLDKAPKGLAEEIGIAIADIPGVIDCHDVRVRTSGPEIFIDAHIHVRGSTHLSHVHAIMDSAEAKIRKLAPRADITIHPEPLQKSEVISKPEK
jgi:cation diffusion facilitator family transporter